LLPRRLSPELSPVTNRWWSHHHRVHLVEEVQKHRTLYPGRPQIDGAVADCLPASSRRGEVMWPWASCAVDLVHAFVAVDVDA
jgi:hypothetical protein